MNTITGLLIDVHKGTVSVETIQRDLSSYYKLLQCSVIDIVPRKINQKTYRFVCDDEGFLVENPRISAIDCHGRQMFVGNLFIVNDKEDEDLHSLTIEDIEYICNHIRMLKTFSTNPSLTPETIPILHHVEYI